MDAERWQHVERLFQSALDLPPDEHDAFLKENCAGDAALEREVRTLLRSAREAGGFLSAPAIEVVARLQLARARTMAADVGRAKAAYQELLQVWKDADPGVPVVSEARAEYARLP